MFDEKVSLESYFGSIGYDFNWEISIPPNEKVIKDIRLYGYPKNQGYQLNRYLGDALIDLFCLLYSFKTCPGISGAPLF